MFHFVVFMLPKVFLFSRNQRYLMSIFYIFHRINVTSTEIASSESSCSSDRFYYVSRQHLHIWLV